MPPKRGTGATAPIHVKLTAEEHQRVKQAAARAGLTISHFTRAALYCYMHGTDPQQKCGSILDVML